MLDVDLKQIKRDNISKKITFSMPTNLINALDEYCKENSLYKSKFVASAVAIAIDNKLGALKTS
jgi:hypothetical protein